MDTSKTSWYQLSTQKALELIVSNQSGLSPAEASKRLIEFGPNELSAKAKPSIIVQFLKQFMSPLIYVLLIAVIISGVMQHYLDAGVIMVILVINAIIGLIQESRAEKAMEALKEMAAPRARVKRDDNIESIPTREVVPGDILLFETGDKVPADIRLLEASNLRANESSLTGESLPVQKQTSEIPQDVEVADRTNLLYMGTIITSGRAVGLAIKTGMNSEIGKIASGIQEAKSEETPLQKNIAGISKFLIFVFLAVCVLLVIIGLLKGLGLVEMFILAVAAAVAAVPEGLPAVVTVVLAIGMHAMARRNAIVRKLVAVETLGSATVICSDKTGTLTLNQMTVEQLYIDGRILEVSGEGYEPAGKFTFNREDVNPSEERTLDRLLKTATLCNDSTLTTNKNKHNIIGDPTEGALVVAAAKAGINREELDKEFPRISEICFESEKQYMATLHRSNNRYLICVKGSVEKVLAFCNSQLTANGVFPLQEKARNEILTAMNGMAKKALRVIAMAYLEISEAPRKLEEKDFSGNAVFAGLAGMADPPRPEAIEAVRLCKQAGIKVVMITGDHKITAESIAGKLNLPEGKAITGSDLQKLSDEELNREIKNISVFARIEPMHKLRIVNALKRQGHGVAMTGDGVNDAPALKAADIGISMGITGTDVAKEASNMVLTDDNFATVVSAIDEGRAIFNRLRNVLFYLLNTNIAELLALIAGIAFIGKAPLLAVQILWVNLITETAGAIPLGLEPKLGYELKQPPRDPRVGIIYPGLLVHTMLVALIMGSLIVGIFIWADSRMSLAEAQTLTFCSLVACRWFIAFSARADETTVFKLGIFRNRWLLIIISCSILLQMAVIYVPFMQTAFGTVPMSLEMWGIALCAGFFLFLLIEGRKQFFPKLFSFGKWKPVRNNHPAE